MNQLKTYQIFIFLFLLLTTFFIFLPIINAGLARTDDSLLLRSDSGSLKNISFNYIIKTFSSYHAGMYHPLVTLSYSIEKQIFGFTPAFFHFDNILIHIANIMLVFTIFIKLSKSFWLSIIITTLFAIHPTRVEVIAWISARKDLLYSLFYLLSILFYIKIYSSKKIKTNIILSVIMFLLSCFSKSMAITLPFALILIDLYTGNFSKQRFKIYLIYIFVSFIFIFVSINSHYDIDNPRFYFTNFVHYINFINAHFNILFYFDKLILPIKLYCMYPYFYDIIYSMPPKFILYSPAVLYLLIFFSYLSLRKTKVIFYGFMFFLITILPVSCFLPIGDFNVADRYTYIPYLGLFFIIAKFIIHIYSTDRIIIFNHTINIEKYIKSIIIIIGLIIFIVFNYLSYRRVIAWKNNDYGRPKTMEYYKFGIVKNMW